MKRVSKAAFLSAWALLLAGCLFEGREGLAGSGTGSETTNHIAGVIWEGEAAAAARVRVALVPADFNPVTGSLPARQIDTTDEEGRFRFENPTEGLYRLEAAGLDNGLQGALPDFAYSQGSRTLPNLLLRGPGHVRVTVPDSLRGLGGHVFIPGTTFRAAVDPGAGLALIGPLPAMRISILAWIGNTQDTQAELGRDVAVAPGDTADVLLAGREARFRLNTTPSGGGIQEDVHGFPLLVRLDSANFDFADAPGGAARIAFHGPDARPLPFQVERWDSLGRKAEIWVRMDTVKANSTSQVLVMRWGLPAPAGIPLPAGASDGPAVFDTARGFAGVWHLGGAAGPRRDATAHGRHGTALGYEGNEAMEGMIGEADSLDGIDDRVDLGIFNVAESITLSAWIRIDRRNMPFARILSKAFDADTVPWKAWSLQFEESGDTPFLELSDGTASYDAGFGVFRAGGWRLLHGTYDGAVLRTYLDGHLVEEIPDYLSGPLHRNAKPVVLGAYDAAGRNPFTGMVDELRIEAVARGAAWIRLCHRNQMPGQSVVVREVE